MMKRYIIERTIPDVGHWSEAQFKEAVGHSNEVLNNLGPDIKWEESFVTDDKLFCIYQAVDEEIIRKHASIGGFPADTVYEIKGTLSPEYGRDYSRPMEQIKPDVNLNFS